MSKEAQGVTERFVDADFDGDVNIWRSTIGFVFSLYGGPIL